MILEMIAEVGWVLVIISPFFWRWIYNKQKEVTETKTMNEITRCGECNLRYSFKCPISIGHQNTVGDDWYCADGKRG